jgi:hypothetical protein
VTAQHRYPVERDGTVIDLGALVGAPESESATIPKWEELGNIVKEAARSIQTDHPRR